jgi:hypothetical protein
VNEVSEEREEVNSCLPAGRASLPRGMRKTERCSTSTSNRESPLLYQACCIVGI